MTCKSIVNDVYIWNIKIKAWFPQRLKRRVIERERETEEKRNEITGIWFIRIPANNIMFIIYGNDIEFFFSFLFWSAVTVIVVIAVAIAIFQFMRMMTSICGSVLFISYLHVNRPTQN